MTEDVANNVAQGNSQHLTEQWKNGELKAGWYYITTTFTDGVLMEWFDGDEFRTLFTCNVKEVLAPVPSYEEWQELQEYKRIVTSYNMKPIDYDIACETVNKLLDEKEKLRNELGLLKESIGKDCGTHYINLFLQENQQLKSLLKEWMHFYPIILYEHEDTLKTKNIVELFDKTREVLK